MPPPSPAAVAAARRLLAGVRGQGGVAGGEDAADVAATVAAVERVTAGVADALARWFGPYGYHALMARALTTARAAHPVLAFVRVRGPLDPTLDGLAEAAAGASLPAVLDGVGAVIAASIDLLGRMVGEDMALHLVERGMDGPMTSAPDQPTSPVAPTGERAP